MMALLNNEQIEISRRKIATAIYRYGFKRSATSIKLSSGQESFFYFDLKKLLGNSEFLMNVIAIYYTQLYKFNLRAVGGIESGSIPIAYGYGLYSFAEGIPMSTFYIRKNSRNHGTMSSIEGSVKSPCVIFEDVITTGKSVIESVIKLRKIYPEIRILGVASIIDRTEDGCRSIGKTLGIDVASLFNYKRFLASNPNLNFQFDSL